MTGRWAWHGVESARGAGFEVSRDNTTVVRVEFYDRNIDPGPPLNAMCAALGQGSAKPAPNVEPVDEIDTRPLTPKMLAKIHVGMAELGYRERPKRLAALSTFLGREVLSTNDLNRSEGGLVIDRIDEKLAQRRRQQQGSAA